MFALSRKGYLVVISTEKICWETISHYNAFFVDDLITPDKLINCHQMAAPLPHQLFALW